MWSDRVVELDAKIDGILRQHSWINRSFGARQLSDLGSEAVEPLACRLNRSEERAKLWMVMTAIGEIGGQRGEGKTRARDQLARLYELLESVGDEHLQGATKLAIQRIERDR